ncbi:MAG: ABC transporter permease [Thermoanaerobacterales bacterium]|nr:ABC transporter permease [Thermoanaerobacterales bacterium]
MSDFVSFLQYNSDAVITATLQHVYLSFGAVFAGASLAIPLGIWLTGREKAAQACLSVTGTIQTIPSLALFGFALPILGIGFFPAMVVLFLYSLLPILRNTYTSLKGVSPALIEAGKGMGMSNCQLLVMVKLPLALPVIMTGIRISSIYIISWATFAAFIGAGGLGDLIVTGIQTMDLYFILAGAIPTALLALVTGWVLGLLERAVTPRGLRIYGVERE